MTKPGSGRRPASPARSWLQSPLLWKLVGIHALVIGVTMVFVWMAVDYRAADYFAALMQAYDITPTVANDMFLQAVHRYLMWAALAALGAALLLSLLLTRRVLAPLFRMADLAGEIARGNYRERLPTPVPGEIGQLADAFNRMAAGLERVERLRKTMIVDVAHELRTPLTNIRGYLEALSDGVLPPSKDAYELLQEETQRLAKLVEGMLQLARAGGAAAHLERADLDLGEQIGQALDLCRAQFEARGIAVEARIENAGRVRADADRLTQVLHNLLDNAARYTPRGGRVEVAAERGGGAMTVTVGNSGDGIAEADLPFVFERFYRGEKSRSRDHGGEGIGLAIVKELVEAHGGTVGADSAGGWTQVWFRLPV